MVDIPASGAAPATCVAIIGCGHWGPNHIRAFQSFPECTVVAVDRDESVRRRLRAGFPHLTVRSDVADVFGDPAVDAVVIVTPTQSHATLIRQALLAGKHVLCEKPLCEHFVEARELQDLARDRRLVLMTGFTFLFNPGIVKLKEMIDGAELGQILSLAAVRTNLGPVRHDVNVALDLASHDVAVFNWLLGEPPRTVSALGGTFLQKGIPDVAFVNLQYPGGCIANIHASWLNPKKVRHLTVVGARRMVTWDDLAWNTPIAIYDCGAGTEPEGENFGEHQRVTTWSGEIRLPKVELSEPLRIQSRHFLQALHGAPLDRSGGEFVVTVTRALEAICLSLQQNGRPVALEEIPVRSA